MPVGPVSALSKLSEAGTDGSFVSVATGTETVSARLGET